MGQYHYTVNLDKRQYLNPHKLGDGLKLLEQAGSRAGVADALLLLLAVSNGRGGGDVITYRTHYSDPLIPEIVGSWGGDRIAVVGDYAEPTDLAPEHQADLIYTMIGVSEALRGNDTESLASTREYWYKPDRDGGPNSAEQHNMSFDELVAASRPWRDISDDIRPVLEEHLGFMFVGKPTGWRTKVEACWSHPRKVKGHWDCDRPNGSRLSAEDLGMFVRLGVPAKMLGVSAHQAKTFANVRRTAFA